MPDPTDLLSTARFLFDDGQSRVSDARLRRAVSTAYYALFHKIARTAATRFMGPGQEASSAYALLYRSFDHRQIRATCENLSASTLSARLQGQLRRIKMSQDMRDFASAFPPLQEARHLADYDPNTRFDATDVFDLLNAAELAMDAFGRVDPQEQTDVLALMMVKTRG